MLFLIYENYDMFKFKLVTINYKSCLLNKKKSQDSTMLD